MRRSHSMRWCFSSGWPGAALVFFLVSIAVASAPQQQETTAHRHPQAQELKNPVPANPQSIEAGKQIFEKYCLECHGDAGKGDGMAGEGMDPPPADLTDAVWKHGSSDGEIFAVVHDGTKEGMKTFKAKLTDRQIWDVVNYVRTLAAGTNNKVR